MKDNDNYINELILKHNEDDMLGGGLGGVYEIKETPRSSEVEVHPPPQIVVEESPQKFEAKGADLVTQSPLKQET